MAIVLGVGTGRCGTLSLAKLLDGCIGFNCTHEAAPTLSWVVSEHEYVDKLCRIRAVDNHGDICAAYLPYLPKFLADIPDLRVIALRRPAEEVAQSFEEWLDTTGPARRHHWYDHGGNGWLQDPYDRTYPSYDIPDRHQALLHYVHDYDTQVDQLRRGHPASIMLIHTRDLGDTDVQQWIFDFADIPRTGQRPQPGINYNSRKEFTVNEQTLETIYPPAADLMRRWRRVERRAGPGELTTNDVKPMRPPRTPVDDLTRAVRLIRSAADRRQRQAHPSPPSPDAD